MTARVEIFLARLYTDGDFLKRFLDDSRQALEGHRLTPEQKESLAAIDRSELILAARSFRHKREGRAK